MLVFQSALGAALHVYILHKHNENINISPVVMYIIYFNRTWFEYGISKFDDIILKRPALCKFSF